MSNIHLDLSVGDDDLLRINIVVKKSNGDVFIIPCSGGALSRDEVEAARKFSLKGIFDDVCIGSDEAAQLLEQLVNSMLSTHIAGRMRVIWNSWKDGLVVSVLVGDRLYPLRLIPWEVMDDLFDRHGDVRM